MACGTEETLDLALADQDLSITLADQLLRLCITGYVEPIQDEALDPLLDEEGNVITEEF